MSLLPVFLWVFLLICAGVCRQMAGASSPPSTAGLAQHAGPRERLARHRALFQMKSERRGFRVAAMTCREPLPVSVQQGKVRGQLTPVNAPEIQGLYVPAGLHLGHPFYRRVNGPTRHLFYSEHDQNWKIVDNVRNIRVVYAASSLGIGWKAAGKIAAGSERLART